MPSRIRIGPDGGPYVIVEENNGDLDITTPDNTIDLQNSGLINAALSGVLDAQNNDISNVGALTADSLSTDGLLINDQGSPRNIHPWRHTETKSLVGVSSVTFTETPTSTGTYAISLDGVGTSSGSVDLQINGNSGNNYDWDLRNGTSDSGDTSITLYNSSTGGLTGYLLLGRTGGIKRCVDGRQTLGFDRGQTLDTGEYNNSGDVSSITLLSSGGDLLGAASVFYDTTTASPDGEY